MTKKATKKTNSKKSTNISNEVEQPLLDQKNTDQLDGSSLLPSNSKNVRKSSPIALSLDEIEELMASKKPSKPENDSTILEDITKPKNIVKDIVVEDKADKKRVLGAASLSDILGYNPKQKKKSSNISEDEVPKKWIKYYKLLINLRSHVSDELTLHTSETLRHSSREESGDLSNFASHQADAGTDTFDRDFALSLVSNEQEALNEIEEAIQRIKEGSFGICEVTGKKIPAARLSAVPFTRFSVEGQSEHERNKGQKIKRNDNPSIFGDMSDAPKLVSSDDDEE